METARTISQGLFCAVDIVYRLALTLESIGGEAEML